MAKSGLQPAIIALNFLCPAISGLVVAARLYQKRVYATIAAEDWIILVAWVLSISTSVLTTMYTLAMYQGYRQEDIPFKKIDFPYAFKVLYAMTLTYNPIMVAIKASFLWSLQKLKSPRVWVNRSLWAIQGINLAYGIVHLFVSAVPCVPVKAKWDFSVKGSCYDDVNFIIGTISVVLITDVMVLIMPTWIIYDLQIPRSRKILAISFLSLGGIVIAVGAVRLVWLYRAVKKIQDPHTVYPALSSIEVAVAIIAASGPTVKWILGCCIPAFRTEVESKKSSGFKPSLVGSSGQRSGRSEGSKQTGYYDLETDKDAAEDFSSQDEINLVHWEGAHHEGAAAHSEVQRGTVPDESIMKTFSVSQTRGGLT